MAYRRTGQRSQVDQDPAFPDIAGTVNTDEPSAASLDRTTFPYNRFSRAPNQHTLILRTDAPDAAAPASDGSSDPSSDGSQYLSSIARSMRLLSAPWLCMPPDGESFHQPATGLAIPPQADGIYHTVLSVTVPNGRSGVLNQIANVYVGGGFTDYSGAVVWQIQRNPGSGISAVERNYEYIPASLGTAAAPGKIAPIRLFENDVIVLAVTNVSIPVGGQTIGGLFGGWFYPRTWDDQFDRADHSLSW
jgi:hypothetical protein